MNSKRWRSRNSVRQNGQRDSSTPWTARARTGRVRHDPPVLSDLRQEAGYADLSRRGPAPGVSGMRRRGRQRPDAARATDEVAPMFCYSLASRLGRVAYRLVLSPTRLTARRCFFRAGNLRESLGPVETRRRTDGTTGRESVERGAGSRRGRRGHYYTTTYYSKLEEKREKLSQIGSILGWSS